MPIHGAAGEKTTGRRPLLLSRSEMYCQSCTGSSNESMEKGRGAVSIRKDTNSTLAGK